MRTVAAALVLVVVLAVMPTAVADNECTAPCQTVVGPAGKIYYLYVQGATCTPPATGSCADQPAALVTGVLYEENGCLAGLQRAATFLCAKDTLVLL